MSSPRDFNNQVIAEFRAKGGVVGGQFEGAPMVLVHHTGRKSGKRYITPMMYLSDDTNPDTIYVFATRSGAPDNPAWYYNLTAASTTRIELGDNIIRVRIAELTGAVRDRIYAEQARRYPGFAEYEQRTAGIRTIPVLALSRTTDEPPAN